MIPAPTEQPGEPPERWVRGDITGLTIPADPETLLEGGSELLTAAFRASGALDDDGRVTRIVDAEEFFGGGTGRKLLLTVSYERLDLDLPKQLFIKFSRHFEDDLRDRGRSMMISEANFAALSRAPGFPVPVPACLFADVEARSATGLIITERITYGHNGVEPLRPKCLDHLLPEPVEHYRAIIRGLAEVSGAHRGGRLPSELDERFPYDHEQASAVFGLHASQEVLLRWASTMFAFIERHPQLFPERLRAPALRGQFITDIPAVVTAQHRIREILLGNPDFIAFAHWNANIDNCWFERDADGELRCGFIDWANAGPTSVAQSILGAISGAEHHVWKDHLDELLGVFIDEYAAQGAPRLDLHELRLHVLLLAALSGVGFAMGAPVAIRREIDDVDALTGPRDQAFRAHDNARVQLHMMTNLLENWQTFSLGELVRQLS